MYLLRFPRSGNWQVWKIPANGPERDARPITTQGGFAPQESPDGRYVYYAKGRDARAGLWRVAADGGPEELVMADLESGYWGYWTIRPEAIYYLEPDGSGHASFSRFDLASRITQRHLGMFADPPFGDSGISMSPDGKWLLYTQVDRSGSDIWIVSAAGI